jgi:hypothetical protein
MDLIFRAHHPTSGTVEFTFEDIRHKLTECREENGLTIVHRENSVLFPDGDWRPLSECDVMLLGKKELLDKIESALRTSETEDTSPPYRCLPPMWPGMIEYKMKRIENIIGSIYDEED